MAFGQRIPERSYTCYAKLSLISHPRRNQPFHEGSIRMPIKGPSSGISN